MFGADHSLENLGYREALRLLRFPSITHQRQPVTCDDAARVIELSNGRFPPQSRPFRETRANKH
jgi:hypothetical protein